MQGRDAPSIPKLVDEVVLRVAGPPRALASSMHGQLVCVGCQDGQLVIGPSAPKQWTSQHEYAREADFESVGIRAVCPLSIPGSPCSGWLVGHLDGVVSFVAAEPTEGGRGFRVHSWRRVLDSVDPGADNLNYVGAFGDDVIVGYIADSDPANVEERSNTRVYQVSWDERGIPHLRAKGALPPRRVVGVARHEDGWLFATSNGEIWWWHDAGVPKKLVGRAGAREMIVDTSPSYFDGQVASSEMVVTTNLGVFTVRWPTREKLQLRPIRLPSARGATLAVTHFQLRQTRYIWTCDSSGTAFIARLGSSKMLLEGVRQMSAESSRSPAIRAIAVPEGFRDERAFIWQSCRNDTLRVAIYSAAEAEFENLTLEEAPDRHDAQHGVYKRNKIAASAPFWCIVADVFEPLPRNIKQLSRFLTNPSVELALEALDTSGASDASKVAMVRCWTQTLVGSILRLSPNEKDTLALGVIEWLHRLEGRCGDARIAEVARECVFQVRRWTLFAPAPPTLFAGVARQVRRLAERSRGRAAPRDRELLLARAAVLFRDRIDEECTLKPSGAPSLGQPFAVRTCRWDDKTSLVAVLWRHSKIGVYRFRADDEECRLERIAEIEAPRERRFGRGLALWKSREKLMLLVSGKGIPVGAHGSTEAGGGPAEGEVESIVLFEIDVPTQGVDKAQYRPRAAISLGSDADDTVHSVLPITLASEPGQPEREPTAFLVSGRHERRARLRVLTLTDSTSAIDRGVDISALYSTADDRAGNKQNAANCIAYDPTTKRATVGCADGQVIVFDVKETPHASNAGERWYSLSDGRVVGRLSVPVWSIACRSHGAEPLLRVYAGSGDGHVMAWQELPNHTRDDSNRSYDTRFTSLWATREADAIVGVSCDTLRVDRVDGELVPTPVVMATSRNGRLVVFWDKAEPEASTDPKHRTRVPGQRLERYVLQDSAFSVGYLPARAAPNEHSHRYPVTTILVVTGNNTLRVVSCFQPKKSTLRSEAYEELVQWWYESTFHGPTNPTTYGAPHDEREAGLGLRYADALRATAPDLWMLAIRKLLPSKGAWDTIALRLCWLPPYQFPIAVRAFVEACAAFRRWEDDRMQLDADAFVDHLKTSLYDAVLHRDPFLFKEITDTVLKRLNLLLIETASEWDEVPLLADCEQRISDAVRLYESAVLELERSCRFWVGVDASGYARVQMARIRSLIDGDVFWALTKKRRSIPPPESGDRMNPARSQLHPGAAADLADCVRRRVEQVHNLLIDGNDIVPLESLRAVNLSLLRATWKARSDRGWMESRDGVLALLGPLGSFASQASASADMDMLHEIARCYALSVLASEDVAIDVAAGLHKARVPSDVMAEVEDQLELLARWLDTPAATEEWRSAMFHAIEAFRSMKDTVQVRAWPHDRDETFWPSTKDRFRRWWRAYAPCAGVVAEIEKLAEVLTRAPETAQLDGLALAQLGVDPASRVDDAPAEIAEYFQEHVRFWQIALHDLEGRLARYSSRESAEALEVNAVRSGQFADKAAEALGVSEERVVRPEIVLMSASIAGWAEDTMSVLHTEYDARRIHDPHYGLYGQALGKLKEAMLGLPSSAAVQRAIVTGVLSHHLLENLDEQVFQLLELSHVLSPRVEWLRGKGAPHARAAAAIDEHHGRVREAPPPETVKRFAYELEMQALAARNAPKNLRTLFQLLDTMKTRGGSYGTDRQLADLVGQVMRNVDCSRVKGLLVAEDAACFEIILRELDSNAAHHGDGRSCTADSDASDNVAHTLRITLPFTNDGPREPDLYDDKWGRIEALRGMNLQRFIVPSPNDAGSNGTGFYLAQLAAAVIGWQLEIGRCMPHRAPGAKCHFTVTISRRDAKSAVA